MGFRSNILLIISSVCAIVNAACPERYIDVGSGCLYAPDDELTYVEAQNLCHSLEGQLAILSNCDIFTQAVHYVDEIENGYDDNFWIGGTFSISNGKWQWRDGTTVAMGVPYWGQSYGGANEPYGGHCAAYCREENFYFGAFDCAAPYSPICAALPTSEGFCNLPFLAVGTQCVHFGRNALNPWNDTREYCKETGGDLIIFETCQQFIDVSHYIQQQGLLPNSSYWIGGAANSKAEWFWIDGSPIPDGVPFWGQYPESPLLPDNSTAERCLELLSDVRHRFNDAECLAIKRPLCMAVPL